MKRKRKFGIFDLNSHPHIPSYDNYSETEFKAPSGRLPASSDDEIPDFIVPRENYLGIVLEQRFILRAFTREENHCSVYRGEDLLSSDQNLEVKGYSLRGIPSKLRTYRKKHMNRQAAKPGFICSFQQGGLIYYVNRTEGLKMQGAPPKEINPQLCFNIRASILHLEDPLERMAMYEMEYPIVGRTRQFIFSPSVVHTYSVQHSAIIACANPFHTPNFTTCTASATMRQLLRNLACHLPTYGKTSRRKL